VETTTAAIKTTVSPLLIRKVGRYKAAIDRGVQQELYVSNTLDCTDTAIARHVQNFTYNTSKKKILTVAYNGFMNIYTPHSKSLEVFFPKDMKSTAEQLRLEVSHASANHCLHKIVNSRQKDTTYFNFR